MPKRASAPLGAPCWVDLLTSDPAGSKAFYSQLFGWTVDEAGPDYGNYFSFVKDGSLVAGGMANSTGGARPDMWAIYLAVEDAKASVEAAADAGGDVMMPVMQVMELGSMAFVTDAGKAAIGVWQPGLHQGFQLIGEAGAPVWFELLTRDYDASVAFYRDVFGWDTHAMSDTAEFRYTTLGEGEGALAGIMDAGGFLPEGVPASWSVYFGVADTDAALAKAVELGGSVTMGPEDTPYGRLAALADPSGAVFKVMSVPALAS
jgi:predicted enzyme related to lactoylglutathione lyase